MHYFSYKECIEHINTLQKQEHVKMKLEKNCLIINHKSINNINNYIVNLMMVYLIALQTKEIGYSLQTILRQMKFSCHFIYVQVLDSHHQQFSVHIYQIEMIDLFMDWLLQLYSVVSNLLLIYEFYYFYFIQLLLITFLLHTVYGSQSKGLRIDLNVEIPLLENQYVIFITNQTSYGANHEIQPQITILADLKNNSLGVYSQKFELLQFYSQEDVACYQQNVMILKNVQSCTQSCTFQYNNKDYLGQSRISESISNNSSYIVDNTQLPCVNGTFFKLLVPWVTVQILFTFQDSSYLIGTIIIVLLVTIITIQIMSIIVLYYKLRKYKKKIKGSEDKTLAKRNIIMRSDYQENNEEQSLSLLEIKSQQISYFQS